ncbi:MAG: alpha/beta hydrolase [Novosphingobium sp.]|nr:alpha/beta hydrolase [Novosphingobium sp.]MCP5378920.1 alpha/beta hydrolase [Novosphingobium sp.]
MAGPAREYTDRYWTSPDGLKLHYREYDGPVDRPPLLCLPGLTRNARDFEPVAERFGGEWRVLCVDLRGRGESEYAKDAMSYHPLTYVADLNALFEQAGIDRFVSVGTSLGGILTMLMAAQDANRIAGAVLNDIGPYIEPAGLERVKTYVGQGRSFPTWMHASRALQEIFAETHPDYQTSDWLAMAKRMMDYTGNGRIAFDYDMNIAEPFNQPGGEAGVDLWPTFETLAGRPLLAIRGGLSDLLSAATLDEMCRRLPGMDALTLPRVGHTPSLAEPEAQQAIAALLSRIS